jgi:hypothetical protein
MDEPANLANFSHPSRGQATKPQSSRFETVLTKRHRRQPHRLIFFFDFSTILC